MISEILRPVCAPRAPMKRIEITRAMPAGARVIRGAKNERKISSNSTRMNRNENDCTLLPVLLELAWLATLVATGPATWNERPAAMFAGLALASLATFSMELTMGCWSAMFC